MALYLSAKSKTACLASHWAKTKADFLRLPRTLENSFNQPYKKYIMTFAGGVLI